MFSSSYIVFACLAFATLLSNCESQVSSLCRPTEVLRVCGGCQRTCRDPNPECNDTCRLGCYCDGEDLVRDDNGICIKYEKCPRKSPGTTIDQPAEEHCKEDEIFEHCSVCEPSCDTPNPVCPAQCTRGCFCRPGLFRDLLTNRCVQRTSCINRKNHQRTHEICRDNEIFHECGICEPTCDTPNPICPTPCKRGCFCQEGFVRDVRTKKCVPRSTCSNSVY